MTNDKEIEPQDGSEQVCSHFRKITQRRRSKVGDWVSGLKSDLLT